MSRTVSTTFLFTDLVGSTRMLERLGPAGDDLLRRHFSLLRSTLPTHGGREVKNLGDGLMVTFATPAAGAACAAAMQRAIARHNATSEAEFALGLRVGVHTGDVVSESGDYFGMPVVVAKRLCDRCGSGQVLVSGVVRDVAAADGLEFADLGPLPLRGLSDPVPAAALDWHVAPSDAVEQPTDNPVVTVGASVADFIRLIAAALNPVTVWIDKRVQVSGDRTLGDRLVELFGGEEPLAVAAELR